MHIRMKKYIIALNTSTTTYVTRPFWYKYWREGRHRKRLGYHITSYKNAAHKFTKRRNIRLIMNDIALRYRRYKWNPILIQYQNQ